MSPVILILTLAIGHQPHDVNWKKVTEQIIDPRKCEVKDRSSRWYWSLTKPNNDDDKESPWLMAVLLLIDGVVQHNILMMLSVRLFFGTYLIPT